MSSYRQNVAAILIDADDYILVAERIDHDEAWQFPQGGVDQGESLESALERELKEELGVAPGSYTLERRLGGYRYDFPHRSRRFGKHRGQEQTYFLCRVERAELSLTVETPEPEFRRIAWIRPEEFRARWLPDFKKAVYAAVLKDFFGVGRLA